MNMKYEYEKGKDYLLNCTTHPLMRIIQNGHDNAVPIGFPRLP